MPMVQLLLETDRYAKDLSALLRGEGFEVVRHATPDFAMEGPVVADRRALERHPALLEYPERVVLIAPNDTKVLSLLWRHNMRSVVFETDPLINVCLTVLGMEIGQGGRTLDRRKNNLVVLGAR